MPSDDREPLSEIAEKPEPLLSLMDTLTDAGLDGAVEAVRDVWRHPRAWADGDLADVIRSHVPDRRSEGLLRLGIAVGVCLERAYPSGRPDEWPVPLDARDGDGREGVVVTLTDDQIAAVQDGEVATVTSDEYAIYVGSKDTREALLEAVRDTDADVSESHATDRGVVEIDSEGEHE